MTDHKQFESLAEACRRVGAYGLSRCSSGNMSYRADEETFLVSCSRSWMERLTTADVSRCRLEDASLLEGKPPSVESRFHAGILRARPEIKVVLHFQSPCATALACRPPHSVNYDLIPEIPFYIGPVAEVPYLLPGSPELAEAVIGAMQDHDLATLNHHGQVTAAADFDHAIQQAMFFELACEVLLKGGTATEPLAPDAIQILRELGGKSEA